MFSLSSFLQVLLDISLRAMIDSYNYLVYMYLQHKKLKIKCITTVMLMSKQTCTYRVKKNCGKLHKNCGKCIEEKKLYTTAPMTTIFLHSADARRRGLADIAHCTYFYEPWLKQRQNLSIEVARNVLDISFYFKQVFSVLFFHNRQGTQKINTTYHQLL